MRWRCDDACRLRAPREHPAERCRVDGVVAALGRTGGPAGPAGASRVAPNISGAALGVVGDLGGVDQVVVEERSCQRLQPLGRVAQGRTGELNDEGILLQGLPHPIDYRPVEVESRGSGRRGRPLRMARSSANLPAGRSAAIEGRRSPVSAPARSSAADRLAEVVVQPGLDAAFAILREGAGGRAMITGCPPAPWAPIFFDDQLAHLKPAAGRVPSIHIPFGIRNVMR